MTTILISLLVFVLLVGSVSALGQRGLLSEDSLVHNLYQLVTGNMRDAGLIVSTVVVTLGLAAFAYLGAGGIQYFMAEMGVANFLMVSVVFPLGALIFANVIWTLIFPFLFKVPP